MPSQADVAVFDALKKAPAKDAAPHAARWYAHIVSFEAAGRKQFPKSQKDAASYVAGGKHNSMFECCSAKYESYQRDWFATSYKSTLRVWLF